MFAKGTYIPGTLEQLAVERTPRVQRCITQDGTTVENELLATPDDWMRLVRPLADQVAKNERYVFFDGHIFPAKHGSVQFDGLFRSHDLPDLPHLSESLMEETLANPDYWDGS
jgi:hypothetical protein